MENNEFADNWNSAKWQEHFNKLKKDPEYKKRWIKYRDNQVIEYWNKLVPFKIESDVPDLPKPLKPFFINKLVELGAIPKDKLIDGEWYYGNYRNSEFGKWSKSKNKFYIIRYKFGNRWDSCNHFEDDDGYSLFVPLRKVNNLEKVEINKLISEIEK
jgi:hypothetical protein